MKSMKTMIAMVALLAVDAALVALGSDPDEWDPATKDYDWPE